MTIKVDEKTIKEIVGELESGCICFLHKSNGSIESYPEELDHYNMDELWKTIIDKIENDLDSYIKFEKMDTHQAYELMSDFASSIDATDFRNRLEEILNRSKPFRHFKHEIDNSDYREAWFDFKHEAYRSLVIKQIELLSA
jgi:hypothetical protein